MRTPFCSTGGSLMSSDHCYWKSTLLSAPSDNSGTFSQEETFCFIPFIFFCLLITNCRRKWVGKSPFLEQRAFPTLSGHFLRCCVVTRGVKPCHLSPGAVACGVVVVLVCPASICSLWCLSWVFLVCPQPLWPAQPCCVWGLHTASTSPEPSLPNCMIDLALVVISWS